MTTEYNGWKNWATWNVALWLQNEESLYRGIRGCESWAHARELLVGCGWGSTPDGVWLLDRTLDEAALDEMVKELT